MKRGGKCTLFTLFCLFGILAAHGGSGSSDSTASSEAKNDAGNDKKKICSCEIMKIGDRGHERKWIVVLAEKSSSNPKSDNRILRYYLHKEKKRIREGIAWKIIRSHSLSSIQPCHKLYEAMLLQRQNLNLYSIIDIDILYQVAKK